MTRRNWFTKLFSAGVATTMNPDLPQDKKLPMRDHEWYPKSRERQQYYLPYQTFLPDPDLE